MNKLEILKATMLATALMALQGGTGALWYVLLIAGVLGATGAASHGKVAVQ